MRIFISGGCKNGKSTLAQKLAYVQKTTSLYYIATMNPVDSEDELRIERHRRERDGWGFETIEMPVGIDKLVDCCAQEGSLLLDSVTALLMNEMFKPDMSVDSGAASRLAGQVRGVIKHYNNIVVVSDYIYSDAMTYPPLVEDYRKGLALIDRSAAAECDVVLDVSFSGIYAFKGRCEFAELYEKTL